MNLSGSYNNSAVKNIAHQNTESGTYQSYSNTKVSEYDKDIHVLGFNPGNNPRVSQSPRVSTFAPNQNNMVGTNQTQDPNKS